MRSHANLDIDKNDAASGRNTSIRVMVVDDSLTARAALSNIVDKATGMAVAVTASSAEIAIRELSRQSVDVILLDLEMPGMGGLEALPKLIATASGSKILVVSSLTQEGAEHTLAALSMGAADTMLKPTSGQFTQEYRTQLIEKIRALGFSRSGNVAAGGKSPAKTKHGIAKRPLAIGIGASTGGIHALNLLLQRLPHRFDVPILITQHLPVNFIPVFARQLEMAAVRETFVASDGLEIKPGTIIVAPGHAHMVPRRAGGEYIVELSDERVESGCVPSVDPMFRGLAQAYRGKALGIVLSGMGRDGIYGAHDLVNSGGAIFAQDEDSCAVWGMPRAVTEAGLVTEIAPPQELANKLLMATGVV